MLTAPTLGGLLRVAAHEAPAAEAFRYRNERLSYQDWDRLADRMAAALAARGVRRGDVVALLLPSTPFYLAAYLGAARIGAVTTGINIRYRRSEIGHILARAEPRLVLAVESWHDADFRSMVKGTEVAWFPASALLAGTEPVIAAFAAQAPTAPAVPVAPEDAVAIVFTSGTTGAPKGAWYAHRSLLALAEIEARRYPSGAPPFRKHLSAGLSFAHIGVMARIGIQIGHLGANLIHDTFDTAVMLETIERERLEHLGTFPTQMIMLLDHPDRGRRDLSSLRSVLLGGSPATPELIRRVQETLRVTVSVRYSSTEVGIATASVDGDPPELLATTVGKATPGVELRVVDDTGRDLPAGDIGEVIVRSPATMCGYWRDPEQTATRMGATGWIHTGDLGSLDEAGYLRLRGRQSEMYIRGGFNVYPSEIEERLAAHAGVARAAVVGVPDAVFGEIGWAFVVPRDLSVPPNLAELRAFVGEELASFKRPDGLTLLPELPLTPMYKVDKRALRALKESPPSR